MAGETVGAGGEATEVFEPVEAALDAVAELADQRIVRDRDFAGPGRGEASAGSDLVQILPQVAGVVSPVGEDSLGPMALLQGWHGKDLVALAGRDYEAGRAFFEPFVVETHIMTTRPITFGEESNYRNRASGFF